MASSRFQNALSLLQKKHKNLWPDPESSVGKFCGTKKGKFKCWKAKGPAHELFQRMSTEIKELLEKDCAPVPSSSFVHFDIFMIGETPATSIPHIMFSCKKSGPRKEALTAVRKSEILSHYTPGIEMGHWVYPPYIKDLQWLGSSMESVDSNENTGTSQRYLTPVYDKTRPWKVSAMQLELNSLEDSFGASRKATVGSILEIAEKRFYLAPAHIFPGTNWTQQTLSDEDIEKDDSDCEFGGFEGLGEEDDVEFMSQYSITPESSDVDPESDCEIDDYTSDGYDEEALSIEPWEESSLDDESGFATDLPALEVAETAREDRTVRLEVNSPSFISVELDYALIEVSNNDYLTTTLPTLSRNTVDQIEPGDFDVTTITGSGKVLTGKLSGRPLYIRFPDIRKYQKAFVVDFTDFLQPGDCGSIVRNARTGNIYGHIFAGSVHSQVAYIVSAIDILEVTERQFNVYPTSDQYETSLAQISVIELESNANGKHDPENALSAMESMIKTHAPEPLLAEKRIYAKNDYTVAWICLLPVEFDAARKLLDEEHNPVPQCVGEQWSYILGNIGQHNIVIPDPSSKAFVGQPASEIASRVLSTFPSIKCGLLVGISTHSHASSTYDIQLGDVVVGAPNCPTSDIVHDGCEMTDDNPRLQEQKRILVTVREDLQDSHKTDNALNTDQRIEALREVRETVDGLNTGQLLERGNCHKCLEGQINCSHDSWDEEKHSPYQSFKQGRYCCQCCHMDNADRATMRNHGPRIHYAHITPSKRVMKGPQIYEIVSRKSSNVLRFEMEAAGVSDNLACLIIQGVCEVAGTNSIEQVKGRRQEYAAAVAAAYARDLLLTVSLEVLRFLCAKCASNDRHQNKTTTETINPSLYDVPLMEPTLRRQSSWGGRCRNWVD